MVFALMRIIQIHSCYKSTLQLAVQLAVKESSQNQSERLLLLGAAGSDDVATKYAILFWIEK